MSHFQQSLSDEIDHLASDRWDRALLLLMPLALLGLMAAMLWDGVPRDLPVAVVVPSESASSRALTQAIEDAPAVKVEAVVAREFDAMRLAREGKIIAFVELPASEGNEQLPIRISYNASYLSSGGIAEAAMAQALMAASESMAIARSGLKGAEAIRIEPVPVSITVLANPETSFEWYLQALVDPAVLHLLIACATAMSMGRVLRGRSFAAWADERGSLSTVAGKLLPYVAIGSAWAAAWLVWIAGVRGWQPQGSLGLILGGQVLLLAGTAVISALLVLVSRETSTALAVSAVYAGSALAYSGGSLPIKGSSLFARGWSGFLPFTHYLDLQMDQWLGAPASVASRQLGILALYVIVPAGMIALLIRRERTR